LIKTAISTHFQRRCGPYFRHRNFVLISAALRWACVTKPPKPRSPNPVGRGFSFFQIKLAAWERGDMVSKATIEQMIPATGSTVKIIDSHSDQTANLERR
jgi:hypothetical protein